MQEAFTRYVGDTCPYFVPREKVTPGQAVRLIRENRRNCPAHPLQYHLSDEELHLICTSEKDGLIGVEVLYSTHTEMDESYAASGPPKAS